MALTRAELAVLIANLVGDVVTIDDAADGWPALGRVRTASGEVAVALFSAPVGLSHRGRDNVERRFQNPAATSQQQATLGWQGKPLVVPDGRVPLLAGLWSEDALVQVVHPVVVLADAHKRAGLTTRHSVFVRTDALVASSATGWADTASSDGEVMLCFNPELLPAVVEAVAVGVELPSRDVALAVDAAGVADPVGGAPAERARRVVSSLVRDAKFSRAVITAYGGLCALCGLDLGLVQGAHIYPASAPQSPDAVWNGLCLCGNHHAAFDRHLIWVDPATRLVTLSPEILAQVDTNAAAGVFAASTREALREPVTEDERPAIAMFEARYEHFEGRYAWV